MKWIKLAAFGLTGLLLVVMTAATFLEKIQGTDFVSAHIYHHPLFIGLWAAVAVCGMTYIFRRKLQKKPVTLLIHLALVVILAGAGTTYLWGEQGSIHLRTDGSARNCFTLDNGTDTPLPFHVQLKGFRIDYYPGTRAPMDFVSQLLVDDGDTHQEGQVSMNRIYTYRHYRFYQTAYDADGNGTTFSVSHDPYGIAITYIGYVLLAVGLILFFFMPGTGFRLLLHHPLLRKGSLVCLLVACGITSLHAEASPRTIPRETAEAMGNLYVYYNDRVCPLQTLARDFTLKIYGSTSYKGLTAEQVLAGWFFYYDAWKNEPMIRIKSGEVKRLLGIEGRYARLNDFVGTDGYKLEQVLEDNRRTNNRRSVEEANEKFNLASMAATGNLLKLYPFRKEGEAQLYWYSPADKLPAEMPHEQGRFIHKCLNFIAEQLARKDYKKAEMFFKKIRSYQEKELGALAPSSCCFRAEKVYNRMNYGKPLAIGCIVLGIATFFYYCRRLVSRPKSGAAHRLIQGILVGIMATASAYLCTVIALRGYIGGHLPLSSGYETMQFMALCALVLTFFLRRKFEMATAFGLLVCGLALLVAMLGESNPPVTPLMPVLASPLLSAHVVSIMLAYSLLAFVLLNGVTATVLHGSHKNRAEEIERLYILSRILLYPAVALLALGIFIGAVWANVSWGRYWGWDPKEVWALITLLVYAAALHPASLPAFRRAMFFHWFSIVAFVSVLITYFGVNFLMGGMHSYA